MSAWNDDEESKVTPDEARADKETRKIQYRLQYDAHNLSMEEKEMENEGE